MSQVEYREYQLQQASSVKLPYLVFGLALMVLGLVIAKFKLPVIAAVEPRGEVHDSVWKHRRLLLGAIGIFMYVGAEVGIGSLLINYMSQPNIGNISLQLAAKFVSLYWGGAMLGRFIGSAVLQKVRTGTVLGLSALVAFVLVVLSMVSFGHLAMWSILLVGFFNSTMFPSIFTLSIEGLGPLTDKGSAILVCAIVGGAVIPKLQGVLADRIGIHHAFILPALCYLYIASFAFKNNKPHSEAPAHS
jgi:FHS family L-fucose permease-like MFS transporter